MNWVYLGKLEYEGGKTGVSRDNAEEAIRLYIFAEKYDTLKLRRELITDICDLLQNLDYDRDDKRSKVLPIAFNNLHETSGLFRLLADNEVYNAIVDDNKEAEEWVAWVPASVAARKLCYHYGNNGPVGDDTYRILDVCDYHEHVSEEDRVDCEH